jgi:serine protease Do
VLGQLKQFGETRRGWLGVRIQTVTEEIAESVGLPREGGALVASVTPDGPAAAAGIQVGDIILTFDGNDITAMRQLPKVVAQTPIDKTVDIVVLRKNDRVTLKAKVGRLEEEAAKPEGGKKSETGGEDEAPAKRASLGLTFSAMTDELRQRYSIGHQVNGVVVTEVDPESTVAETEIKPGDVVVEVTHEKVASPADIDARIQALRKLNRKSALLTLSDGQGEVSFVAVTLPVTE